MSDREIRRMRPDEIEEVVRVWRRSREEAQPWLEARMRHTPDDDLRRLRDVIAVNCEVWVALESKRVVGLLALSHGHVDQLYVEPAAQRRGVGTAPIEQARELFPAGLTLFTHQRNARARAFYERRGFRAVRSGVSPPRESEPDLAYAWRPNEPAPSRSLHRGPDAGRRGTVLVFELSGGPSAVLRLRRPASRTARGTA